MSHSVKSPKSEKKKSYIEGCLVIYLRHALDEYLSETTFGVGSLWKHGSRGRKRAENIQKILDAGELNSSPEEIWSILWAIYQTTTDTLKDILTGRLVYSGIISHNLYEKVKEYRKTYDIPLAHEKAVLDNITEKLEKVKPKYKEHLVSLVKFLNGDIENNEIMPLPGPEEQ